MSQVPVSITFSGTLGSAHPNTVIVKLSQGQNQVKWTSSDDFVIHIQSTAINASQQGNQYVATSQTFTAPGNIQYSISRAAGGPPSDPEIQVEG